MKWNGKRIWIALGIAAVVGTLIFLFEESPPRFNWKETYDRERKDPYGTHVIYELLGSYFEDAPLHPMDDSLRLPKGGPPANYVFIGAGQYLDSAAAHQLLHFAETGNTVFISSRVLPYELTSELKPYVFCMENYWYWEYYQDVKDSVGRFELLHPQLKDTTSHLFKYYYREEVRPYYWQYIDSIMFCEPDSGLVALGTMNDSLFNFARLAHGDGFFYFHTAPIAFSNIQLLEEPAVRYAERVFSHLVPGPIYWDEHSKVSEEVARQRNRSAGSPPPERRLDAQSPLQYVLQQPALTWAWYLLLALALLYLLFRAKRRQRIIPVLEENKNTSLEFLSTIGRLYFMQNDHRRLAMQQMKLWRAYVRNRYGLKTMELDDRLIEKLTGKSEIPGEVIQELFSQYRDIEQANRIGDDTLVAFHRKMDFFYKHCK